ncbi:hypothetical protein B5E58_11935 [Tyzzerella sp. An114]|uniref:RICIN domain-containing protein n=1 Tax=Tyzzerella sp. An114 TaxID=1965545 RepID=UPI000B45325B|nr:RICIN domain-containing protein [Tyzzerella sp. An114]OUQ55660.1 hypothetical protein B5E58_11935 [Tyzzerella sp. An114]
MKKSSKIFSLILVFVLTLNSFIFSSYAATKYTESQFKTIEQHFDQHPYVLKKNFYGNATNTGRIITRDLQNLYNALGYNVDVDSLWGFQMEKTTKEIQRKLGLKVDGIVGNDTFNALMKYSRKTLLDKNRVIEDGNYSISPKCAPELVADVSNASINNSANIQLYTPNGTEAQIVKVEYIGDGWYKFIFACSNKVLDVAGGSSKSGTNVQQYEWNNTSAQYWKIVSAGDGYYYIINKSGNKYLDVQNGADTPGANVWVYNENKTDAQKWKFNKITNTQNASFSSELLNLATAQNGQNYKRYGGSSSTPWCGYYVRWLLKNSLNKVEINYKEVIPYNSLAGAISTFNAYRSNEYGKYYNLTSWSYNGTYASKNSTNNDYTPKPGDILLVETNGDIKDGPDHLAIVVKTNSDGTFVTSEGNTGSGTNSTRTVKNYTYKKSDGTWQRSNCSGVYGKVHVICTLNIN